MAGSDPSSGAGVAADILTFNALGVHGVFIITAVTAQTLNRVFKIRKIDQEDFSAQMEAVFKSFKPDAVKTGLISTPYQAKLIREYISKYNLRLVADPVFKASDGTVFSDEETVNELIRGVYPKTVLITPNISEAEIIAGCEIKVLRDAIDASHVLVKRGLKAVLIKGGHLNTAGEVLDVLNIGGEVKIFRKTRLMHGKIHGTGCILSAAITSYIAKGCSISEAVMRGEEYFNRLFIHPLILKDGGGLLQPFKFLSDCSEKLDVLNEINYAVNILTRITEFITPFIDEESVLAFSISKPVDIGDVASLKLKGNNVKDSFRLDCPTFGLDNLAARVILSVKKWFPLIRAGLSLPYNNKLVRSIEKTDEFQYIQVYFKEFLTGTMDLFEETCKNLSRRLADGILDFLILFLEDTPYRIIILGENSFEVIYKLIKILKKSEGF
ncbi:MAG: bifunctional hydroxymethylpyrimidine kinase/phosphomethylpyrimidine kinase [Candidatus Odinarchaeota archaeon]